MRDMIPEVNIISRKVSTARVDGLRGAQSPSAGVLGGRSPKKILGSKEHLDWFKIIPVQDYKLTKN